MASTPNLATGGPIPAPASDTAGQIMALLTEIGESQIIKEDLEFHPWFWEHSQGKLMDVWKIYYINFLDFLLLNLDFWHIFFYTHILL